MSSKKPLDLFLPTKAASHRQKKIAQEVKICLATFAARNDWPVKLDEHGNHLKAPAIITITDVNISADLKNATVSFMPLGGSISTGANNNTGEKQTGSITEQTQNFLDAMKGSLRKELAKKLTLRTVPNLTFCTDTSFAAMGRIDELLRKINTSEITLEDANEDQADETQLAS